MSHEIQFPLRSNGGPYAEGVTFHSPGSRSGEAAKRTLGRETPKMTAERKRYQQHGGLTRTNQTATRIEIAVE